MGRRRRGGGIEKKSRAEGARWQTEAFCLRNTNGTQRVTLGKIEAQGGRKWTMEPKGTIASRPHPGHANGEHKVPRTGLDNYASNPPTSAPTALSVPFEEQNAHMRCFSFSSLLPLESLFACSGTSVLRGSLSLELR